MVLLSAHCDFLKLIQRVFLSLKFPVGVDVFPYTRQELKTMIKEGNLFIKTALEQGRSL